MAQQDAKVVVKIMGNPSSRHDLEPFMEAYKDLIHKHRSVPLIIMFDLSLLNVVRFHAKIIISTLLVKFFSDLKERSESNIAAVAVRLHKNHKMLMKTINNGIRLCPGKIPTLVSHDMRACKNFLRRFGRAQPVLVK